MDRTDRAAASRVLLLADDSATIQRVIELTFSGEDVTVIAVSDGEQAIARIPVDHPDIILADIGMPKRNGYDVAAFVKGHPDYQHIPVLLLAGAFEPVDQQRAEQVGCNGVLVKPFEPQHVIARVRELLDGVKGTAVKAVTDVARPVERVAAPPRTLEFPRREEPRAPLIETAPKAFPTESAPKALPAETAPKAPVAQAPPEPLKMVPDPIKMVPEPMKMAPEPMRIEPEPVDEYDFIDRSGPDPMEALAEPPGADESLDDYFDRLDAAFATFDTGRKLPPPPASRGAAALDERLDVPTLDTLLGANAAAPPAPIDLPLRAVAPPPVEPPDITPTRAPQVSDQVPDAVAAHPATRSLVADAFTALLAVEQGEPGATAVRLTSGPEPPLITDALLDELTRRVVARLAPDVVRDVVAQVVSEVSERLVREEIDRIRNHSPKM